MMAPRFARTAALTIGGGLVVSAAGMTGASATEPGNATTYKPVIAQSMLWTTLDDVVRVESGQTQAPTDSSEHATAETATGQVVPLTEYEVGHLYGVVSSVHTGGVHSGVDLSAPQGTPIYAVEGGKVVAAEWQGAAGKAVTIKTTDEHLILYGHMSSMLVDKGDRVETGQKIGRVGSTGNSTGPHLHLGVTKPNGSLMDPLLWMDVSAKELKHLSQ